MLSSRIPRVLTYGPREGESVPTYQYTCTHCGEPVEAVQKFSDAPLTVCAACGGRLRKVFSPVGIVFKGSGFYRNDSRERTKKDKALNGASSGSARSGSDSSAADSSGSSDGGKDSAKDGGSSSGDKKADKPAAAVSSSSGDSSSSGSSSSGSSSSAGSSSSSSGSKVA